MGKLQSCKQRTKHRHISHRFALLNHYFHRLTPFPVHVFIWSGSKYFFITLSLTCLWVVLVLYGASMCFLVIVCVCESSGVFVFFMLRQGPLLMSSPCLQILAGACRLDSDRAPESMFSRLLDMFVFLCTAHRQKRQTNWTDGNCSERECT
jgi:hypothetical protein